MRSWLVASVIAPIAGAWVFFAAARNAQRRDLAPLLPTPNTGATEDDGPPNWSRSCPEIIGGLLRPIMTSSGHVIVVCDEHDEVWLRPQDVGAVPPLIPRHPDGHVIDDIRIGPGSRPATRAEVRAAGWPAE